jgi:uncharacterized protein YbjT (DUF2867 family)
MPSAPHPLNGMLITLVGGGGFVGRHAAQALMAAGARVRIVQRSPRRAFAVRALGNLGQVQFVAANATDAAAMARAVAGSDAVVNFVATLKGDFDRTITLPARTVAAAARDAGCSAFVHISAIGADAASPSAYGRAKAAAEDAVRAALPSAIILRPSIIFGREDQFINRFAGLIQRLPVMPVLAPNTRFQPVFVGDVADAIVAALANPAAHGGQTFELGGPQTLSMRALYEWIARQIGRSRLFVDVPDAAGSALAAATGWLPAAPITRDQWAMLGRDNVVTDGAPGLAALNVASTALDTVAVGWLDRYRRHGRFTAAPLAPAKPTA